MRRILARPFFALAAAVLATAVFLPDAPLAHAQPAQNYVTPQAATANTYVTPQAATGAAGDGSSLYSSSQLGSGLTAGAQAQSASGQQSGSALGAPKDPTFGGDAGSQFGSVMTWIMTLFAWLVGVAALSLDYVAYYTVVSMGSYVGNITAIGVAWRVLRDIANIMLIFGFLAIGITTILQVSWYGGAQKLLPKLVIAAVAMNFSLFVCEALIDGTNIIATQFYQQINGGQPLTQTTLANTKVNFVSGSNTDIGNEPISNAIMGQLGFQTLYNAGNVNQKAYEGSNTWLFGFLAIILFGVTAFVLFSLTLILVARFVALIFFILLSPVGFMGWAVPLMQGRADQWWKNFLDQIITAPILFLLLYVALAVITDAKFLTGDCGGGTCTKTWGFVGGNNLVGFASMLLSFMIAIGLLLVVTIKARSMGAFGADWAMKWGSRLSGAAVAAGSVAWIGRSTVGAGGRLAAKGLGNTRFGRSFVGRPIVDALEKKVAGASFDVRSVEAVRKFAGSAGLALGAAQKGGYTADVKARVESYERAAGRIRAKGKEAKKEKDALETANKALVAAQKDKEDRSKEYQAMVPAETAAKEAAARQAEFEQLEAEIKEKTGGGVFKASPEQQRALDEARQKAAKSAAVATSSAEAFEALKSAAAALDAAAKQQKEAAGNVGNATKAEKQKYIESLESWSKSTAFGNMSSVPGFFGGMVPVLGVAAGEAAARLKKNAGKTQEERELDALLKKIKKAGGGGGEEKKEEK